MAVKSDGEKHKKDFESEKASGEKKALTAENGHIRKKYSLFSPLATCREDAKTRQNPAKRRVKKSVYCGKRAYKKKNIRCSHSSPPAAKI